MKPDDIPERILDRYRYCDVADEHWYSDLIQTFIEEQTDQGIEIEPDKVNFSGFCSQGDGASFHGYVIPDLAAYITQHLDPKNYPFTMLMLAADCTHDIHLYRVSNSYSHEHTVAASLDIQDSLELIYDPEHPLIEPQWGTWSAQFHAEQEALEQDVIDDMRSRMKALYKQLNDEYDYLTSDEYVRELLADNPHIWQDDLEEAA